MEIQTILDNIESYDKPIRDAIRLAVATAEGEVLELMLEQIVGDK